MPYQGFPSLCPASPPAFRPLPHPPCPHQNPFLFTWRRKKVISTWLVKVSERNQLGLGELLLFFPGNSQGPGTPCPPSSKGLGAGRPCQHSNDQEECPRLLSISGCFQTHSAWVAVPLHTWSDVHGGARRRLGVHPQGRPFNWADKTHDSKEGGLIWGWTANEIGCVAPRRAGKSQMPLEEGHGAWSPFSSFLLNFQGQ